MAASVCPQQPYQLLQGLELLEGFPAIIAIVNGAAKRRPERVPELGVMTAAARTHCMFKNIQFCKQPAGRWRSDAKFLQRLTSRRRNPVRRPWWAKSYLDVDACNSVPRQHIAYFLLHD